MHRIENIFLLGQVKGKIAEMAVQWRLRELLETENVTAYALAEKMGGATRRSTLYTITSPDPAKRPTRVGLSLIADILGALKSITGKNFSVADIIENDEII